MSRKALVEVLIGLETINLREFKGVCQGLLLVSPTGSQDQVDCLLELSDVIERLGLEAKWPLQVKAMKTAIDFAMRKRYRQQRADGTKLNDFVEEYNSKLKLIMNMHTVKQLLNDNADWSDFCLEVMELTSTKSGEAMFGHSRPKVLKGYLERYCEQLLDSLYSTKTTITKQVVSHFIRQVQEESVRLAIDKVVGRHKIKMYYGALKLMKAVQDSSDEARNRIDLRCRMWGMGQSIAELDIEKALYPEEPDAASPIIDDDVASSMSKARAMMNKTLETHKAVGGGVAAVAAVRSRLSTLQTTSRSGRQ